MTKMATGVDDDDDVDGDGVMGDEVDDDGDDDNDDDDGAMGSGANGIRQQQRWQRHDGQRDMTTMATTIARRRRR